MGRFSKKRPDKHGDAAETQRRAEKEQRKAEKEAEQAAKAEQKAAARELLRDARAHRANPGTGGPL